MKKVLLQFDAGGRMVDFDSEQGLATPHLGADQSSDRGVAFFEEETNKWFAFYEDSESFVFQAGTQRWDLDESTRCDYWNLGKIRLFVLWQGLLPVFRKVIHPEKRPFDPTADFLDEVHDDFFRLLKSRRTNH